MKPKSYFATENSELCYSKEYHICEAIDQGLKEIKLYEAVPDIFSGYAFCREILYLIDIGEHTCGKICGYYSPRNGKSGCCRHYSKIMYEPGKQVTFKIK